MVIDWEVFTVNRATMVCVPCRYARKGRAVCERCGQQMIVKVNWSAPSKNNKRAWKRIERGEWLWNRRKVRKRPRNAALDPRSWVSLPGHKPGQRKKFFSNVPTRSGPDVDMGG